MIPRQFGRLGLVVVNRTGEKQCTELSGIYSINKDALLEPKYVLRKILPFDGKYIKIA